MRVVIGEDEALLRQGLALLLRQDGFDVVEVAPDAVAHDRHLGHHDDLHHDHNDGRGS